jgi:hypothetical protein
MTSAPFCNPKHERKRLLGPRPEFANQRLTTRCHEVAQDERDNDRVIELPRDRDEVRYEIEGQREITHESEQKQLMTPGDTLFAKKASNEDDAVRNERRKRPRILAPSPYYEPSDERRQHHGQCTERHEKPFPPLHERSGYGRFQRGNKI